MFKHANTVFPGDPVTKIQASKTAAKVRGTVLIDTVEGKVKVAWADGTETFEDPNELRKEI